MKNYDGSIDKRKSYWRTVIKQSQASGSYVLRNRVINKLKNARMLAAFYEVYEETISKDPNIKKLVCEDKCSKVFVDG